VSRRPELGPRVVNLTSTLMRIDKAWDGTQMVEASVWAVQISDVPVNMTEAGRDGEIRGR